MRWNWWHHWHCLAKCQHKSVTSVEQQDCMCSVHPMWYALHQLTGQFSALHTWNTGISGMLQPLNKQGKNVNWCKHLTIAHLKCKEILAMDSAQCSIQWHHSSGPSLLILQPTSPDHNMYNLYLRAHRSKNPPVLDSVWWNILFFVDATHQWLTPQRYVNRQNHESPGPPFCLDAQTKLVHFINSETSRPQVVWWWPKAQLLSGIWIVPVVIDRLPSLEAENTSCSLLAIF